MRKEKILLNTMIVIFFISIIISHQILSKNETSSMVAYFNKKKSQELFVRQLYERMDKLELDCKTTITLSATGDIMFHTPQVYSAYNSEKKEYNFYPMFQYVKKYIESADIAIGNFETVTAGPEHGIEGYPLFNTPKTVVKALKDVGFDILSTANNHSLDRGKEGIIETIDNIKKYGLENIGTYKKDDREVLIKSIKGIKVGLLSYTYGCNGMERLLSEEELNYMVNIIDEEKIKKDIKKVEEKGADITVVFLHWGNEYQRKPSKNQITLAEKMIRWGADIILGSHPHVIQKSKILQYKGEEKFVIYSMGNFISNQRYETLKNRYTEDGVIVKIQIEKDFYNNKTKIKDIKYIPTWVNRYRKQGKFRYEILPVEEYINGSSTRFNSSVIERMKKSYNHTMKNMDQN
ncbi:CapA family protein [Thermohalobacter berrensis]|uniref:Capsule synthesis protein CapA domain-containing protein n=1 Tax=Thermohalobacter berrensis TaxID=99594 RepID=A0A419T9T4_9FIRM|nr:CapA family protein [Thermohalobacter berrensis]RKD34217.1 hypothetical protein BET03_07980 [Thermohalobacter berrensis]